MAKTVLLGRQNNFSPRTNKLLHLLIGVLFILNGSLQIYRTPFGTLGLIIGIATLIMGIFYLWFAFIVMSPKSRFAPKVTINDETIFLKNRVLGGNKTLSWQNVKSITFKPYEIIFDLGGNEHSFSYEAGAESSIEIKEAFRKISEQKNISVIGG